MGAAGLSDDLDTAFLRFGEQLDRSLESQRAANAEGLKNRIGPMWSCRMAIVSAIGSALSWADRAYPIEDAETKLWRASIHATVVQGISPIETLIGTATYAQASAAVRQEIEAVEALVGLRKGTQKAGRTPAIRAFKHLRRSYGQLSGVAHLSKPWELVELTNVIAGGVDHSVIAKYEQFLFRIHLNALCGIAIDIAEFRPFSEEMFQSPQEAAWLSAACGMLAAEIDSGFEAS